MKKLIEEFKAFILRGNVLDMAVGVIVGGAFTSIVNSLVNDVFMPLISLLTGGVDFNAWNVALSEGEEPVILALGSFVAAIVNFLLIALVLFLVIKGINKLHKPKAEEPAPEPRLCPFCKQPIADDATRCPHCTSELDK